jgi:sarcosine dehydrogenase
VQGYKAIDSLSAEKGYRHWHADLSNRDTPIEAGIGFTVLPRLKLMDEVRACDGGGRPECACESAYPWKKVGADKTPEFIGRDALAHQRDAGLQRKLICLTVDTDTSSSQPPLHGLETIWRNGACVGYVRSTAYGHTLGKVIAYGYVDCDPSESKISNKWLSSGEWSIGDRGRTRPATYHAKSPFDPNGERIQGVYAPKK